MHKCSPAFPTPSTATQHMCLCTCKHTHTRTHTHTHTHTCLIDYVFQKGPRLGETYLLKQTGCESHLGSINTKFTAGLTGRTESGKFPLCLVKFHLSSRMVFIWVVLCWS